MYQRLKVEKVLKDSKALEIHNDVIRLKNGGGSHKYFDITKVYLRPNHFNSLVDGLWDMIKSKHMDHLNIDYVAASGYGGIPFAAAIASKYHLGLLPIREKNKGYGISKEEILKGVKRNETVSLIDGVMTSGGSFLKMAKPLIDRGLNVEGAYVVVDRSEEELLFDNITKKRRYEGIKNEWEKLKIPVCSLYKSRTLT